MRLGTEPRILHPCLSLHLPPLYPLCRPSTLRVLPRDTSNGPPRGLDVFDESIRGYFRYANSLPAWERSRPLHAIAMGWLSLLTRLRRQRRINGVRVAPLRPSSRYFASVKQAESRRGPSDGELSVTRLLANCYQLFPRRAISNASVKDKKKKIRFLIPGISRIVRGKEWKSFNFNIISK